MYKEKLTGRFYLKSTRNGNLIGEFSNNVNPVILTESADRITSSKSADSPFIGNFISTWQENGAPISAKLQIEFKYGVNEQIFTLKWRLDENTNYIGEGMLCDDILIGDYRLE